MTTAEHHDVPTDLLDDAAERMRGLDLTPSVVVPADEEANPLELAAETSAARALTGAIGVAYDILIDQLFSDLQTLTEAGGSAAGNMVVVLDELPSQYEDRYTAGFLHRFLAVAFDLGQRMSTEYTGPSCVAQELVIELLLNQVGTVATAFEQQLHPDWRDIAEEFLLADADYRLLYQETPYTPEAYPDSLGMADMSFEQWFMPFTGQAVNPYTATIVED